MKQVALGILVLLAWPVTASAHVVVQDDTGTAAAVLHVTPDDNPIAGELSDIFLDTQTARLSEKTHSFRLSITTPQQQQITVPITTKENSISGTYTFPAQGSYTIELFARPRASGEPVRHFQYTQTVSRGVGEGQLRPLPLWVIVGLAASGGFLCTVLLMLWKKSRAS